MKMAPEAHPQGHLRNQRSPNHATTGKGLWSPPGAFSIYTGGGRAAAARIGRRRDEHTGSGAGGGGGSGTRQGSSSRASGGGGRRWAERQGDRRQTGNHDHVGRWWRGRLRCGRRGRRGSDGCHVDTGGDPPAGAMPLLVIDRWTPESSYPGRGAHRTLWPVAVDRRRLVGHRNPASWMRFARHQLQARWYLAARTAVDVARGSVGSNDTGPKSFAIGFIAWNHVCAGSLPPYRFPVAALAQQIRTTLTASGESSKNIVRRGILVGEAQEPPTTGAIRWYPSCPTSAGPSPPRSATGRRGAADQNPSTAHCQRVGQPDRYRLFALWGLQRHLVAGAVDDLVDRRRGHHHMPPEARVALRHWTIRVR